MEFLFLRNKELRHKGRLLRRNRLHPGGKVRAKGRAAPYGMRERTINENERMLPRINDGREKRLHEHILGGQQIIEMLLPLRHGLFLY